MNTFTTVEFPHCVTLRRAALARQRQKEQGTASVLLKYPQVVRNRYHCMTIGKKTKRILDIFPIVFPDVLNVHSATTGFHAYGKSQPLSWLKLWQPPILIASRILRGTKSFPRTSSSYTKINEVIYQWPDKHK